MIDLLLHQKRTNTYTLQEISPYDIIILINKGELLMSNIPLFIITGASASGKTFVIKELRRIMPEYCIFDYDSIFQFMKDDAGKVDYQKVQNIWLRVARNIAESGRKTILCGLIKPKYVEKCKDFKYFHNIYYLILHCDDKTREIRLRSRKKMTEEKIQSNNNLANLLIKNADKYLPPMGIVNTSHNDVTKVADEIKNWIYERSNEI